MVISTLSRLTWPLTDEVLETTRAGDDDVDAPGAGRATWGSARPRRRRCGWTSGWLASRGWRAPRSGGDEPAGGARIRARGRLGCAVPEAPGGRRGEQEGGGLAGPGAASAQDVAPGEGARQGGCLDGVGVVMPRSARTEVRLEGTPSAPKVLVDKGFTAPWKVVLPGARSRGASGIDGSGLTSLGLPLHAAAGRRCPAVGGESGPRQN